MELVNKQENNSIVNEICEFNNTSLQFRRIPSLDEFESICNTLGAMDRSIMWWIGDALAYGEITYGETYTQFAELTGKDIETIKKAKKVCERVEIGRRRPSLSFSHHDEVAYLESDQQEFYLAKAEKEKLTRKELRIALGKGPLATLHTGEIEWYTPEDYIESVRKVMGSIDIDPASNSEANKIVKADKYYTLDDCGLDKSWNGNIWLNPPYSAKEIKQFINKYESEIINGNIKQGIILTNNNTDTSWFHKLAKISDLICFTAGRINFYRGDVVSSPTNGQSFIYYGENKDKFISEFSSHGIIMEVCHVAQ